MTNPENTSTDVVWLTANDKKNGSKSKDSNSTISKNTDQEIDNSSRLADGELSTKLKQKNREVEQLAISPDDILEELEKRQPFCQKEE